MSNGTYAQRIIALLSEMSGLDDDEISSALSIAKRQTINQICRQLAASGLLRRGAALPESSSIASVMAAPRSCVFHRERHGLRR